MKLKTRVKNYIFLAGLILSLRYCRGHLKLRNKKYLLALPEFLNTFLAHKLGWIHLYIQELFTRYHPHSALRNYESDQLYKPENMKSKIDSDDIKLVALPNKDNITLVGTTRLKTLKDTLVKTYAHGKPKDERTYAESQLVQVFDSLPTIESSSIIGKHYDGFVVPCDPHQALNWVFPSNKRLKDMGWGKIFFSKHLSAPVVVNFKKEYYFSVPFSGNTSIIDVKFRDKVSAAMAYQTFPVTDYFRCLQESNETQPCLLLGMYMLREKLGGFFILREDKESVFI